MIVAAERDPAIDVVPFQRLTGFTQARIQTQGFLIGAQRIVSGAKLLADCAQTVVRQRIGRIVLQYLAVG